MNNLEKLKSMSVDELVDWLDKHGSFDDSPWLKWFVSECCDKCEPIICICDDAKQALGFEPLLGNDVECAYCEVHNKCKFFSDLNEVPSNKYIIKLWLESETE